MNYLQITILYAVKKFNGERSINAVYYLFKGKKSSQTIQDAAWYSLKNLFNIYPSLTRKNFQEAYQQLIQNNFLTVDQQSVILTNRGSQYLKTMLQKYPLPKYLDGWEFHHFDYIFWQRLSLIIQVLSNWSHGDVRFFPIQREAPIQRWTKKWFQDIRKNYSKKLLTEKFYDELTTILMKAEKNQLNPAFFVYRLTGYKEPGKTSTQIAEQFSIDVTYYTIVFQSLLHFMLCTIWKNRSSFPMLYTISKDGKRPLVLTHSTMKTLEYIKQGMSLEKIAKIRGLKKSTIEDHIVEIALMDPDFSITDFVNLKLQEKIKRTVHKLQTRKLRMIKDEIKEADYFSIRLVLAKWNE